MTKILALCGSLRAASAHLVLLKAAQELAPEGTTIEIFPLNDVPMYNGDVEAAGMPDAVAALHEAVAGADGLLLASPEYNGSVSGALKNAIDWCSRDKALLAKKPVATMGGSPGALGATKGQEHLRSICSHLGMYLMTRPTVSVPHFFKKIEDGKLNDEQTSEFISQQIVAFTGWIKMTGSA